MPDLRVLTIPALTDNYIFLLIDGTRAVCIDPGETTGVEQALAEHGLTLDAIWLTHHHNDHIGGAAALRARHGCRLIGFAEDAYRLPPLDETVTEGSTLTFAGAEVEVWHVPGHTLGHIAYVLRDSAMLFCGDTLFLGGCGRLFEGTAEQMFQALQRFSTLTDDTQIYCAHEYTETNYRFACHEYPEDILLADHLAEIRRIRAKGNATIPADLGTEKRHNPFLLTVAAEDEMIFAALRSKRNRWS